MDAMAGDEPIGSLPAHFDGGLAVGQRMAGVETAVVGLSSLAGRGPSGDDWDRQTSRHAAN